MEMQIRHPISASGTRTEIFDVGACSVPGETGELVWEAFILWTEKPIHTISYGKSFYNFR